MKTGIVSSQYYWVLPCIVVLIVSELGPWKVESVVLTVTILFTESYVKGVVSTEVSVCIRGQLVGW